jgi:nucleotide-binding universal stress UspA family protein
VVHVQKDVAAQSDARARRRVAVATARALAEHPGLSVSGLLVGGNPADVLNEVADMCLLVVGHQGGGDGPHVAWTVTRIMQKARVPVLVHRALDWHDTQTLPRPVLVGVGDGKADDVLAFAFEEASLRGAPLLAMRVWGSEVSTAAGHPAQQTAASADPAEADRSLREALAAWSEKYPEVAVTRVVRHGCDVALPLVTASRAAQLAVVGRSDHQHPAWPALASVSHFLMRRAHCPVAVVAHL